MCISVAIWNRLFVKTAIIHHDAVIKFPDLKGSGQKRKEKAEKEDGSSQKEKKKSVKGIMEAAQKGSHTSKRQTAIC